MGTSASNQQNNTTHPCLQMPFLCGSVLKSMSTVTFFSPQSVPCRFLWICVPFPTVHTDLLFKLSFLFLLQSSIFVMVGWVWNNKSKEEWGQLFTLVELIIKPSHFLMWKIIQWYVEHGYFCHTSVSCVSTQDDYFKSWAPAKSLDEGELLFFHMVLMANLKYFQENTCLVLSNPIKNILILISTLLKLRNIENRHNQKHGVFLLKYSFDLWANVYSLCMCAASVGLMNKMFKSFCNVHFCNY